MKHLLTILSIILIFTFIIFVPYYIGEFFLQRTPPEVLKTSGNLWFEGLVTMIFAILACAILVCIYISIYSGINKWLNKNKKQ